jgi:hypothetical protein
MGQMIARPYVVACDKCKSHIEILKGASSIGGAFKAVKKLPWARDHSNTVHTCPKCLGTK